MSTIPFYAKRWVAGTNLTESLDVVHNLNSKKIGSTIDLLGEHVTEKDAARRAKDEYLSLLEGLAKLQGDNHISLKLTLLGLDISEQVCQENLYPVLAKADELKFRVALDMEGSPYTEKTMMMYEKAAKEFKSPEIVLQAYLKRTESDLERVFAANGKLRLCKGAYKEDAEIAFKSMSDVVANYKMLVQKCLTSGVHVGIASHDDNIINFCRKFIADNKISTDKYEFQMLYGMREKTWASLVAEKHPMVVYVPYGANWQAYLMRRLAERKENVFFIMKNLFRA